MACEESSSIRQGNGGGKVSRRVACCKDCVERVLDYFKRAVCTVEGFGDFGEGVSDVVEGVLRCHVRV